MNSNELHKLTNIVKDSPNPADIQRGFEVLLGRKLGGECLVSHFKIEAGVLSATFTMKMDEFMKVDSASPSSSADRQ